MLPFLAFLAVQVATATPPPVTIPAQPALTEQIAAADAELFELSFIQPCDVPRFRAMLTDDVEFYHDRAGFNVRKADDFVAIYTRQCTSRADPRASRSRRELVAATLHVDPVPGWGAIETGEHLFYERQGKDAPEKLVGRARFAQLWVLGSDGKWRVSRVFSYAHGPAS
jgi:uncharacterized protein DUF4440